MIKSPFLFIFFLLFFYLFIFFAKEVYFHSLSQKFTGVVSLYNAFHRGFWFPDFAQMYYILYVIYLIMFHLCFISILSSELLFWENLALSIYNIVFSYFNTKFTRVGFGT
jgi:hypothetical protein